MRFFEDAELEAGEKIARALFPLAGKRYAAKMAAGMETRRLTSELAAARTALEQRIVHSQLDTAIWILASLAELQCRGVKLQPRVVLAKAPVDPGTLTVVMSPDQALRFAVLTRSRGLGLTLNLSAGEMRISKEMTLGGAEQLLTRTPDRLLPLQKPWDFAQLSDSEISADLADMQEERYYFHKHAIRGTMTPALAADRERMESWGAAARDELAARTQEQEARTFGPGSSSCWGCREDQPNQLAHMEPGGCCYVEEEEE